MIIYEAEIPENKAGIGTASVWYPNILDICGFEIPEGAMPGEIVMDRRTGIRGKYLGQNVRVGGVIYKARRHNDGKQI